MTLSSIDGASSVEEAQLRDEETTLLLTLHGPALWSASARSGGLTGLRLSLQPAVSLKLLRVAAPEPRQLVLTLERHPTFDVPHDVPLTLHVTHTCAGSMLQTTALACTDAVTAQAGTRLPSAPSPRPFVSSSFLCAQALQDDLDTGAAPSPPRDSAVHAAAHRSGGHLDPIVVQTISTLAVCAFLVVALYLVRLYFLRSRCVPRV